MMAWRKWMAPLMIGAVLGAGLAVALAPLPHKDTLPLVLLVIQIPILIWDVVVTTRMLRRGNRVAEELVRHIQGRERSRWN